jgi:5-methylthioadenosine/S-adenosylhomocysteine deaminase
LDALITDTTVVTCDEARRIIEHGAVAIVGNRIAAVGATADLEGVYPDAERISGRGLAVLPGFINAHTHTVLSALRGTVEDWSGEIIYSYMSPVSYAMSGAERSVMAALGCLEAIRSGTTTVGRSFPACRHLCRSDGRYGLRLWLSESCADIDTRKIRFGEYGVDEAFGASLPRPHPRAWSRAGTVRATAGSTAKSRRMRPTTARPACCAG